MSSSVKRSSRRTSFFPRFVVEEIPELDDQMRMLDSVELLVPLDEEDEKHNDENILLPITPTSVKIKRAKSRLFNRTDFGNQKPAAMSETMQLSAKSPIAKEVSCDKSTDALPKSKASKTNCTDSKRSESAKTQFSVTPVEVQVEVERRLKEASSKAADIESRKKMNEVRCRDARASIRSSIRAGNTTSRLTPTAAGKFQSRLKKPTSMEALTKTAKREIATKSAQVNTRSSLLCKPLTFGLQTPTRIRNSNIIPPSSVTSSASSTSSLTSSAKKPKYRGSIPVFPAMGFNKNTLSASKRHMSATTTTLRQRLASKPRAKAAMRPMPSVLKPSAAVPSEILERAAELSQTMAAMTPPHATTTSVFASMSTPKATPTKLSFGFQVMDTSISSILDDSISHSNNKALPLVGRFALKSEATHSIAAEQRALRMKDDLRETFLKNNKTRKTDRLNAKRLLQ